ncbi:MAG TPA: DUF3006 domain-containing protein [Firmicutes bacterium]|nr:DUF3006 domain-containing protein [Bacillota bacterium]
MLIVERWEGEWAVLEWEQGTFNFPRVLLPPEVREGDALCLTVKRDEEMTRQRRAAAAKRLERLLAPPEEG